MPNFLSNRINAIKPSATFAISGKAQQLKAAGKDVINLGTGEPDFDTPEHIKLAAAEAIRQGMTKYTATDGVVALKSAIISKFERDNQLTYAPNQILVSNGAKQSIFNVMIALLNPGDEVVIPAPYWVSYPDMVNLMGGTPVVIHAGIEQEFKINAEQLKKAITPKTKLFIMNSPNNPSGAVYTKAELTALAEVLKQHPQVIIITDDIYEKLIWHPEGFANLLNVCPELYDRTIVINGVSKAYAMTGWRIGYAAGNSDIIAAMKKAQEQSTSNPCSISQAATIEALNGDQACVSNMVNAYKKRCDLLQARFAKLKHFHLAPIYGAFYAFINVDEAIERVNVENEVAYDDVAFSDYLLTHAELALVPGSAFGAPGHLRMSFATSEDMINRAIDRIEKLFP